MLNICGSNPHSESLPDNNDWKIFHFGWLNICMQWQKKLSPMYNLIFSLQLDTEIPLKVWINLSARIFFVFQTSAQAGSGAAWTRLLGFILAKSTQDGIQISFGAKSFNFNFKRCLTSWPQKRTAYSSMKKNYWHKQNVIHDIYHFFFTEDIFGSICLHIESAQIATKQRKLQQKWFCNKTAKIA